MFKTSLLPTEFQSTLPIQGETMLNLPGLRKRRHFNPLSLYRERQIQAMPKTITNIFQSTLPIQGETNAAQ